MSQIQICDDCCEYLEPFTKKLGKIKKWLKCPKCGILYRESQIEAQSKNSRESLIDRRTLGNKTGFKKQNYNDLANPDEQY